MKIRNEFLIVSIIMIVGVILFVGCTNYSKRCTLEAKICADGSSVGRNPDNNCEFDPCPITEAKAAAQAPLVTLEATVMSLYLDELYEDGKLDPRDRASISIDNIDSSKDPQNTIKYTVGDKLDIHFLYSARPAKIKKIQGTEETNGNMTSYSVPKIRAIGTEGDYLIFESGQAEAILPGLKEGDKIKISIWAGNIRGRSPNLYIEIGEYELIK